MACKQRPRYWHRLPLRPLSPVFPHHRRLLPSLVNLVDDLQALIDTSPPL